MELNTFIRNYPGIVTGQPATRQMIDACQDQLRLQFAEEFISFLQNYGFAIVGGETILGISGTDAFDVLPQTQRMRILYSNFPSDAYVVCPSEDGLAIIQKQDGAIFVFSKDGLAQCASSLLDFLKGIH